MQISPNNLRFGKATFTVTNGDDLKTWANPQAVPKAIEDLTVSADYFNTRDTYVREKLDAIPNNLELEFSYSKIGVLGANSYGIVASSPETITVYEVDPEKPGERKLFTPKPSFVIDKGSWTDASSGEGRREFVFRVLNTLGKLLAPEAEEKPDSSKS